MFALSNCRWRSLSLVIILLNFPPNKEFMLILLDSIRIDCTQILACELTTNSWYTINECLPPILWWLAGLFVLHSSICPSLSRSLSHTWSLENRIESNLFGVCLIWNRNRQLGCVRNVWEWMINDVRPLRLVASPRSTMGWPLWLVRLASCLGASCAHYCQPPHRIWISMRESGFVLSLKREDHNN